MLGNADNPGLTFRTVMSLYERLEAERKEQPQMDCQLAVSYVEVYNETVIDLINPGMRTKRT